MKCSVIQSGKQMLTTTVKPNHMGLNWSRECIRERERCALKAIILLQSAAGVSMQSFCLCSKHISVYACVCCLLSTRLQGPSVNQSSLILYTSSPDGYSLQLFSIQKLLTPGPGSSAKPAADMNHFSKRAK